ncbi:MAG TPA: heme ABC exporter ATP-binding protein CcmA [Acidimicrobiia bacterium]
MGSLVELEGVGVASGGTLILDEVALTLAAGECVAIEGPNGAGKTTLLRLIATLLRPSRGDGRVLGARLGSSNVREVRADIGLAGHQPALAESLSLLENLTFVARLSGLSPADAESVLAVVGLAGVGDTRASVCSQGMRKRADLARLLLRPARLLLLDEPLAGLDAAAQPLVGELVRRCVQAGGGAIIVSHDSSPLAAVPHRRLRLAGGHLERQP